MNFSLFLFYFNKDFISMVSSIFLLLYFCLKIYSMLFTESVHQLLREGDEKMLKLNLSFIKELSSSCSSAIEQSAAVVGALAVLFNSNELFRLYGCTLFDRLPFVFLYILTNILCSLSVAETVTFRLFSCETILTTS